jgi:hypothetical protein
MTAAPVTCFMVSIAHRSQYRLRRYVPSSKAGEKNCPSAYGFHNAFSPVLWETADDAKKPWLCTNPPARPRANDARWPKKCDGCDYEFKPEDVRQVFGDPLYRRADTGEALILEKMPAGATWDADWNPWKGPDGLSIHVKLPDGFQWHVDGKANNCRCDGTDPAHHCWTRTGVPPF